MIVITTPTGNIGHQVLGHVLTAGRPVRVIVRDPLRLPADVRDRVEVVPGSHGDPAVVDRAFDGADAVFWLVPTNRQAASAEEAYVEFTRPAVAAMSRLGVRRVVSISALGRTTPYADKAGYATGTMAMDDLIAGTGVALRALALPSFMDNMLRQVRSLKEQGTFFDAVSPGRAAPTAATRDVAAVAARLLLDDTWTGQSEVPLLGPEDLSPDDMAAIMSSVLGTPIRYQQVSEQAFRDRLTGVGVSDAMVQGMVDMLVAKENGLDDGVPRTPQHALDTPTTFRQWCVDVLRPAVAAA